MNPYPLLLLNHFTRPCATCLSSLLRSGDEKKAPGVVRPWGQYMSPNRNFTNLAGGIVGRWRLKVKVQYARILGVERFQEGGVCGVLGELVEELDHGVVS